MRTGLIIFGVIFLVIGVLLYFVPVQEIKADTTTVGADDLDARTSTASVTVPRGWAIAAGTIGLVLLILGLVIPHPSMKNNSKEAYTKVVESKEDIEVGDGNKRKIIKERTEKYKGGK